MKMSAWIRFCLIVLCLAMACSMFACRNPEEQTTEKPEQVTTEAPSVEKPTEQPTEKPTETPTEVTTEEPVVTTEPTEVTTEPTEVTTEVPATETTEAPATETTEAPVIETTEAPATETTEAPATETTEEVTNTYLEEETIVIGGIEYVEEAASPYAYAIDSHGGAPGQTIIATADNFTQVVSGLKGWIAIRPGILKYVYAIVVDGVQGEWIDFTKDNVPGASTTVGYDRSDVITHIGNNLPGFESGIAGTNCGFNFTHTIDLSQYHGKDVSIVYYAVVYKVDGAGDRALDPNGNGIEGAWIHMATAIDVMPEHYGVGEYRDNGDGTHSIKCEGCDEYYITEACNPAFGSGATATDTNTHTGMTCGLCGQTGIEGPHSAPSNYVWDDEKGIYTTYYNEVVWNSTQNKYNSVCIACGGQVGDAFGAVHSVELETITMGGVWETAQSNEETYAIITMKAGLQDSKWRATYFKVNPNGLRTGQYLAIRYMIPTEGANPTHFTIVNGGWSVDVPVIADGEWHIVLVEAPGKDASFAIPTGDTRLNFIGAYTGWNEGDQICLDWLKTYDSVEAIQLDLQIGQEACACPAWAIEVVEYAGVEAHSVRCTVCGKMDTAAHTPSSTIGVAVEGGYVKVCTVCGGATAEPAMGNYVFDKADLLNGIHSTSLTKEETETGVKFTNPDAHDRNFTVFQSVTGVQTGKYLFFKYRADASAVSTFTASDYAAPTGSRTYGLTLDCDGGWHIAVIEIPLVANAEDGKYYAQHLRVDVEGSVGAWMELEYIGYADNAYTLAKAIKALDSNATAYCTCASVLLKSTSIDEYTHAPTCQLCGDAKDAVAHTAPLTAWNAETNRYEATCSDCGSLAVKDWQWSRYYSDYAEGHRFASTGGGNSHSVQNGILVMTPNGNTSWGGVSVGTGVGATKLGQYYVFKYRVPEGGATSGVTSVKFNLRFNSNRAAAVSMVVDGEWHIKVVDIAAIAGKTAENGLFDSDGDHWFCNYADANLLKYEVAFEGCVDSLDRLPEGLVTTDVVCDHSYTANVIIDEESHGVKCVVCDATLSSEKHIWSSTDCTTVIPACSCGAEKEELGHTAGGTDGEICVVCKTFLYANPSEYFVQFWGGNSKISNSTFTGKYAESGYPIYYSASGEARTQIVNTATTFRYAVIKYKALGGFGFQFFAKSDGGAINGAEGYCKGVDMVYDEWTYAIIDLNQMMPSGAPLDGDENCNITGLWIDFEGTAGTVEFGYLAVAATIEDLVAGIKAIENDNVDADYCPHIEAMHINPEYKDLYSHDATCSLCGVNVTVAHSGGALGVWSDTLGYYESANACRACGQKYDFESTYFEEAENGVVKGQGSAWGSSHVAKNGYVEYSKYNSTWGAGYNSFNTAGVTTGRYLAVRYRVEEGSGTKVLFDETIVMPVIADGDWHVALLDVGTDIFTLGAKKFMFTSAEGWDVGSKIWFDWFRTYDSLDRIPDFGDECAHGVSAPDAVWAVVGDGTATEAAACAVCGEAGASIRALSTTSSWGDKMYSDDGNAVLENGLIMKGWTLMTGGVLRGEFVITDGENTVTVVYDITTPSNDVATQGSNKYAYMGEDRGYSRYQLEIEDWSNVQGVDFTGKQITITAYAVSKADPTIRIKTVSARPATVAAATAEPTEVPAE